MKILLNGICGRMGREVEKLALTGYRGAELVGGVDPSGEFLDVVGVDAIRRGDNRNRSPFDTAADNRRLGRDLKAELRLHRAIIIRLGEEVCPIIDVGRGRIVLHRRALPSADRDEATEDYGQLAIGVFTAEPLEV